MNHYYRLLALLSLLLSTTTSLAQSPASFALARTYKTTGTADDPLALSFPANSTQTTSQITYFDGLGKPVQQVMAFQGAAKGDVVTLTEYDQQFRPVRTYLPAPYSSNGTAAYAAGDVRAKAETYYKDAQKLSAPINSGAAQEDVSTRTSYETAPLSRVTSQRAPGAAATTNQVHGVNSDLEVKYYRTTGSGLTAIEQAGAYAAGELRFVRTTDESNTVVTEYQDRYGRTVLKRVGSDDPFLYTYYVYDEKGQLRAVLQPNYQSIGSNTLQQSAFLYRYDERGRLVEKQVPGASAVLMSYLSNTDLLATMTDGRGQVFYYTYDNLNRQTEMGVNGQPLLYTYYDNYTSFTPFQGYTNELGLSGTQFAGTPQVERKGLVTGSKARILLANGTLGDWLQTVNYYDDKYRLIQRIRQLYGFSGGAFERVSYQLAFDGKPEQEWTTQATGSVTYRLVKAFRYDHANRLLGIDHKLYENNLDPAAYVKQYTHVEQLYNEVGQLAAKSLHGTVQVLNYQYTPRGWLGQQQTTGGQRFSLGLSYQDNGNISQQSWATKSYSGGMSLSYDQASRLSGATGTGGFGGNNESPIQYDYNGNISSLTRSYNNTVIDQLGYQYDGNRLRQVTDMAANEATRNDDAGQLVKGFTNRADAADELDYDANGNLIKDANRQIGSVTYNVLNLPRQVLRNGRLVQYTYDATGTKHRSEAPDGVNTFYAGAFEYRAENSLLRIGLEEGQLVKGGSGFGVQYYLRDHLGNVRSVVNESGGVVQETEYYAFGLAVQRNGSDQNKYLYNGKEKQPETEWLDYGARMYDPTIGRFNSLDNLAEAFTDVSPFSYGLNNPVFNIDPTGDSTVPAGPMGLLGADQWHSFDTQNDEIGLNEVKVTTQHSEEQYASTRQLLVDSPNFRRVFAGESIAERARVLGGSVDAVESDLTFESWWIGGKALKPILGAVGGLFRGGVERSRVWEVGVYNEIRGVEAGLDAHHVGQKAVMSKLINGYDLSTAPSILVPEVGHTVRGINGIVSRSTSGFTNARQVLARDIFELRRVYGVQGLPNSSLQQLIQMNKTMYPQAFIK